MSQSAHEIRQELKTQLEGFLHWAEKHHKMDEVLSKVKAWKKETDEMVLVKIKTLQHSFDEFDLSGDYSESVGKGFITIRHLLDNEKVIFDFKHIDNTHELIHQIRTHYIKTLLPLLNIFSELENDYAGLTRNSILTKKENLNRIQLKLENLKAEEQSLANHLFVLKKQEKLHKINHQIRALKLKRRMLKLSIHHDKLNLGCFNYHEPPELQEIKQKTDLLRDQITRLMREVYG